MRAAREDCQTGATLCCKEHSGIVKQFSLADSVPGALHNHDVKVRRPRDALTSIAPYLTLVPQLNEAHLSKERVAKPPV